MSQGNQGVDQASKLAGLVGQIGCVTGLASIVIIAVAYAIGRFLDNLLEADGILIVLFLIGSFPITLYVIVRISLSAVRRAQPQINDMQSDKSDEEITTGEETNK